MPKGSGRPSTRREKQAVETIRAHKRKGIDTHSTKRGSMAEHTMFHRIQKDVVREFGTSRSEVGRRKNPKTPYLRKPPKGFK